MRKDFGAKTWVYPMPVFIIATYGADGTPDAMNAAWGGIIGGNKISFCISENHKTTENFLARKAFTVSMADAAHEVECDYVGVVSAHKVPDKLDKAGFHTTPSKLVDAPIIDELPMTLECRLVSYDTETEQLVGEIVNVSAEETILDENGQIDLTKFEPITFDPVHGSYLKLGAVAGKAFSDGKKIK